MNNVTYRGTTVLAIKKDNTLAMGCDGQVTLGDTVIKSQAVKLRKVYNDKVMTGFAGSVADALTLFERFEQKLESYSGNIPRSVVELARDWRLDRALRRLEAVLIVGDPQHLYLISGNGEIIEPDDGILGIGSGGNYALAAARALLRNTSLDALEIVKQSLLIASEICIYSNSNIVIEEIKQ
ncbi:MAG TPA: ATP-dependent protease subunit HslV [Spirochaetota bacterium]|nr:ATP-dependent protease subunit HslV [Spirochaetota bacterium]HOM88514.1 ATP-dependent protease subunit HslV [Spirochaetota bacterium]HOR93795.1 ATP-dependent protease subunit HslV [Spirochaetota bacterium]HOT20161.1 ATP-dependent protease subunit HslV [Spirochaetota bacterium]HPD05314.1 ATP-dependent protease subunit HslV [Spirochaetota bacterium]